MKKFLVTYHSTPEAMAAWANATPEQKAEGMKPWMAWKEKAGDHVLDFGAPLMGGTEVSTAGNSASNRQITGYSMLQATDMDQATSLLADHPHSVAPGNSVEVHETMPM